MQLYLTEMINERKSSGGKDERRDLLSNLVDANEEFLDSGEQRLLHEEVIGMRSAVGVAAFCLKISPSGNIFVFYIAGHGVRTHRSTQLIPRSER